MASEDTLKRFFNLGTRHIAIGVIGTAVLCVIVLILASVNVSKLSRIEEDTSSLTQAIPSDCSKLSTTSDINDVNRCFPGYFITNEKYELITKLHKLPPIHMIDDGEINGKVQHGCCESKGYFHSPKILKDIKNINRTIARFDKRRQHFYVVECTRIANCDLDCTCTQQTSITTAVYVDEADEYILKLEWFFIDGCCLCVNK